MVALQSKPDIVVVRFEELLSSVSEILLTDTAHGREPAGTSYAAIAASRRYLRARGDRKSVAYRDAVDQLNAATGEAERADKTSESAWAAWYVAYRVRQLSVYDRKGLLFVRESQELREGLERLTG